MIHQEISCDKMADADLEATLTQNMTSTSKSCMDIDGCVAEDSQSEDNDSYVVNCKIHFSGSDASKKRQLVNMFTRGSGTHFTSPNELLTLIGVGTPSDLSLTVSNSKSGVFTGLSFCFSSTFPDEARENVAGWIQRGHGKLVEVTEKNVDFIVEAHGVRCSPSDGVTKVSAHWITCCVLNGGLLDVGSSVLFSPLQCELPLPGFSSIRFFVSRKVDMGSRDLLINFFTVLGGKLPKALTKSVTYFIYKLPEGREYETACALKIRTVTYDWILDFINHVSLFLLA